MKNMLKKGDGLATIIITIVLIAIVLMIVPAFKAFMKQNTQATENMGSRIVRLTQN